MAAHHRIIINAGDFAVLRLARFQIIKVFTRMHQRQLPLVRFFRLQPPQLAPNALLLQLGADGADARRRFRMVAPRLVLQKYRMAHPYSARLFAQQPL